VRVTARAATDLVRIEPQWAFDEGRVRQFERRGFAIARQFIMPLRTLLVDLSREKVLKNDV
jgi:hypothetical protein